MPELPEVEAARRAIEDHCIGKKIKRSVIADDSKVIDGVSPSSFKESITGKTIVAAHRKGKNMWLQLDSPPFPSFQFGMAGAIYIKGVAVTKYKRSAVNEEDEWPSKYSKLFIELDDGLELSFTDKRRFAKLDDGLELSFTDKRRFAKVRLLENPTSVPPISELGPDALLAPLTIEELSNSLSKKKIGIKTLLLDQSFISGVGNWIADEVLYQARIHPLHVASSISRESCAALHKCLKEVIGKAVEVGADSSQFPSNWIFHSREKKPGKALVDGKKIEFITAGGRTTAYVPELQKLSGAQAAKAPSKPRKGTTKTTKDEDDDNADEQGSEEEDGKAVKPKGRKATTKSKVKKPPAKRKSTKDEDDDDDDDDDDADEQGIEEEEDDKAVKSKGRKVTAKSKPKKPPTKRESKESDNESSEDENDDVEGDEQTKGVLPTRGKPKETEKGTRGNKKTNARTKAEEEEDEDEDKEVDTKRRKGVAENKTKKKAETTQTGKQTKKRAK